MIGKFQKGLVLLGLCSVSFYCGAQIAGQTEAAFSSKALLQPIEVSAAIVFPSTIQELNVSAKQINVDMLSIYKSIPKVSDTPSLEELKKSLETLSTKERELQKLLSRFDHIHIELAAYYTQVRSLDQNTYRFVLEGWNEIDSLSKQIKKTIDFQYIKKYRTTLELRIKRLEEEAKSEPVQKLEEVTEDAPSTENVEIIEQIEGVPENDEKRLEINNETTE